MRGKTELEIIRGIKDMVNRKCSVCGRTFKASKEDNMCLDCAMTEEDEIFFERDMGLGNR